MAKLAKAFLIIATMGFVYSCSTSSSDKNKSNSIVSVSILPQKYIIDRLTDSTIQVNVLVPPSASPEMYEPTPKVLKDLSKSSVYMAIGPLPFEQELVKKIKDINPELNIVIHAENRDLLEDNCDHSHHHHNGAHSHMDPHIWSSPKEYKHMAQQSLEALIKAFPDKADLFNHNMVALSSEIDAIDSLFAQISASAKIKKLLIFHPALGYLVRDYNLEQQALEEDGKSPSAEKVKNMISTNRGVSVVFIQTQFDTKNAEVLAWELGAEVYPINPLGYNWPNEMRILAKGVALATKSDFNIE